MGESLCASCENCFEVTYDPVNMGAEYQITEAKCLVTGATHFMVGTVSKCTKYKERPKDKEA